MAATGGTDTESENWREGSKEAGGARKRIGEEEMTG